MHSHSVVRPELSQRHIVITGASGGLGAALAIHYASQGVRLSLFGRDRKRLDAIVERCRARGAEANPSCCDVTDGAAMADLLSGADDLAPVTHIIANAGIGGLAALAPSTGETSEAARAMIGANILGLVNTLTPLLPRLVSRRAGSICIISSLAGYTGLPSSPVYSASKAAARVYGEGLRRLLRPSGLQVTVACPGFIETPMSAALPMQRPFLVDAERAAICIAGAIDRRRAEIAFPWQLALAARLGQWMPNAVMDLLLSSFAVRGAER